MNRMRPESLGSSLRISRARVVFPQPLSPTSPSVLPAGIVSDTSSTAVTHPVVRRRAPRWTG
ncbi:MAG: hypothetical protein MUE48_09030 [Desulfobacterales bacterium]|nr:hypothetical protein [Desulfobacterales bacterium]